MVIFKIRNSFSLRFSSRSSVWIACQYLSRSVPCC